MFVTLQQCLTTVNNTSLDCLINSNTPIDVTPMYFALLWRNLPCGWKSSYILFMTWWRGWKYRRNMGGETENWHEGEQFLVNQVNRVKNVRFTDSSVKNNMEHSYLGLDFKIRKHIFCAITCLYNMNFGVI